MRRYCKRYFAGILVVAMFAGAFSNYLGKASSVQATTELVQSYEQYVSFDDYRTAYEALPTTTSNWTLGRAEKLETLDNVTFCGEVIFSAEGSATNCTMIIGGNYLSATETDRDKTMCGIGFYVNSGKLYAYNHYTMDTKEIGVAAVGYPVRLSVLFDKQHGSKWDVTYTVNGMTYEKVTYSQTIDFGNYIMLRPNESQDSDTNSITCNSVQEGYTYLSFHDYRIQGVNASVANDWTEIPETISTSFHASTPQVNTLDKVIFQGKFVFTAVDQSFGLGAVRQATDGAVSDKTGYGLRFYANNGNLYVKNAYTPNVADVLLCSVTLGAENNIRLQFDQTAPGHWTVTYQINGVNGIFTCVNLFTDGKYYDFGPQLYFAPGSNASMIAISVNGNNPVQILESVSYDLDGKDSEYLVTGTASVVDDTRNVILITPCEDPILREAGDYTITTYAGSFPRVQEVSLYKLGDLNFDYLCDADDYTELIDLLGNENTIGFTANTAKECAADLNNNGKVDKKDLELLDTIVNKKTATLDAVKEKYHVGSVSYDYLGGKDVMPVVGYYGPYFGPIGQKTYNYLNDDVYQKIKTLGINLISDSPNQLGNNTGTRYVYQQLELAERYGIGQFIADTNLNPELEKDGQGRYIEVADAAGPTIEELAEQIGKYSYFGSYLGTYVRDEPYFFYPEVENPTATNISENNKQLKYFDWIAKKMNQFANNLGFINSVGSGSESIFATWATSTNLKNFRDGLEEIYNRTGAKIFSHTSYPFSGATALDDTSHTSDCNHDKWVYVDGKGCPAQSWQHYYKNLWDSMEVAKEKNGAFWAYTAAGGDFRDGASTGATQSEMLPTEQETYWDINNKLAFGAKGIEYFTLLQPWYYVQDTTQPDGVDYNRSGLLNLKGELTTYGEYAVEINKHIAAIDDVLMRSSSKGIIATGTKTQNLVTSDGDALLTAGTTKLASVGGGTSNGYGALVGCFNYGDTEAFYVVNYSLDTTQSFTLNFRDIYNYRYVSEATNYTGSAKTLTLSNVKPGRGVLVVLDEEDVRYADEVNKVLKVQATDMTSDGKNITFYTGSTKSLHGSSVQDSVTFAYDTDAVFLNGNAIRPSIKEVNDHGVWGFQLDMSGIELAKGDIIKLEGTIYPTSGNERGRLTSVLSTYYEWTGSEWSTLSNGYYDVALYKGENATMNYPEVSGMLFAGWYTDDTCKTVYTDSAGIAYAKFVNAGVMANLAQIPVDVNYDSSETKMRFVSTVDSLYYSEVGFKIRVEGSSKGPRDVVSKDVYKTIVATEGGVPFNKAPTDIHKDSKWFFTYTLTGITNELFGRKIYVTPFWITLDGTTVYGECKAKTVNMGISTNKGENNNYNDDEVINGGTDNDEAGSGGFIEIEDPETGYGPIS